MTILLFQKPLYRPLRAGDYQPSIKGLRRKARKQARKERQRPVVDYERIKRQAKAKQMQEDVKALVMMDLI